MKTKSFIQSTTILMIGIIILLPMGCNKKEDSPEPVTDFSANPTTIMFGNSVYFQDLTTNDPTSWSWNFGDGNSSADKNPTHIYNTVGVYTVSLNASNSHGSDSKTKENFIHVLGACEGVTTVSDFDGNVYNTIDIGNQCWMKENLNVGVMVDSTIKHSDNATIEKYCFRDEAANCNIYGGIYLWEEIMKYTDTEGAQGICPNGWHIPTKAECNQLMNFLGGELVAGGKMKENGLAHWINPNYGASNESGFTALPGGQFIDNYYGGYFDGLGALANFWTSTAKDDFWSWNMELTTGETKLHVVIKHIYDGVSVRCIRN
ncbi:FISUMP domain-containing protein [candidate division KSB1 bacterium]